MHFFLAHYLICFMVNENVQLPMPCTNYSWASQEDLFLSKTGHFFNTTVYPLDHLLSNGILNPLGGDWGGKGCNPPKYKSFSHLAVSSTGTHCPIPRRCMKGEFRTEEAIKRKQGLLCSSPSPKSCLYILIKRS